MLRKFGIERHDKDQYANDMENRANDTPWSFALREMHALSRSVRFWALLGGVIAVVSLTGPFGTYDRLSVPGRALYWAMAVAGSFAAGLLCSLLVSGHAERAGLGEWPALLLGGLSAGVPVAALNGAMGALVFGGDFVAAFGRILPYTLAIAPIVAVLYELNITRGGAPPEARRDRVAPSVLLSRLPPHLGRDIVHLRAQDHYVEVTTPRGSALVLMRIGDAERELGAGAGMRVHRSWWVGERHARRLVRRDGKAYVETSLGTRIPVGRAYRKQVRAALDSR